MICEGTEVRVIDNSGPVIGRCIKILRPKSGAGRRVGREGNIISLVVTKTSTGGALKKGDVVRALIVRTVGGTPMAAGERLSIGPLEVRGKKSGIEGKRDYYGDNAVVIIKMGTAGTGGGNVKRIRDITPIGTRIRGPIGDKVRLTKYNAKVISLVSF